MRKFLTCAVIVMATFLVLPNVSHAASASPEQLGKILIDGERNGEAWYVNPQTHMKVYLGRPHEALERLSRSGINISFVSIARLSESVAVPQDDEYAVAVSGFVLNPKDVLGASWYVNPVTGRRMRLATPHDAWMVMQTGASVPSSAIDGITEELAPEATFISAAVVEVESANILKLADGTRVQLLSVEIPDNPELQEAAMALISSRVAHTTVTLERDKKSLAPDATPYRFVHANGVNISHDLIRNGLAFPDIKYPNYRYAEMFQVAFLDAARLEVGFWNPIYQATRILQ